MFEYKSFNDCVVSILVSRRKAGESPSAPRPLLMLSLCNADFKFVDIEGCVPKLHLLSWDEKGIVRIC